MLDASTILGLVLGFSALNFVIGYVLGHYGLNTIKTELATIKDLISGQTKAVSTSAAAGEAALIAAAAPAA